MLGGKKNKEEEQKKNELKKLIETIRNPETTEEIKQQSIDAIQKSMISPDGYWFELIQRAHLKKNADDISKIMEIFSPVFDLAEEMVRETFPPKEDVQKRKYLTRVGGLPYVYTTFYS